MIVVKEMAVCFVSDNTENETHVRTFLCYKKCVWSFRLRNAGQEHQRPLLTSHGTCMQAFLLALSFCPPCSLLYLQSLLSCWNLLLNLIILLSVPLHTLYHALFSSRSYQIALRSSLHFPVSPFLITHHIVIE